MTIDYRKTQNGRGLSGRSHSWILILESLESAGGALVDAGTAVDALGGIDDSDVVAGDGTLGDVVAGDGTLGAHIDASSTADTLGLFDCYHLDNLRIEDGKTL